MAARVETRAASGALSTDALRRYALVGVWVAVVVAVGVAVALPDQLEDALIGVVAVGGTILTFIQPLVGVPLLLLAVPFGSRASTTDASTGTTSTTTTTTGTDTAVGAAELVIALLTLAWLARGARRRELNIQAGPIVVAIVAMVVLAAVSIGYALDATSAIKETLKWLELLLALLIVVDLVRDPSSARWVIAAMLVAGAAEAAYGAMQFFTDSGPAAFDLQGVLRAFGHFDQPNPFAGYLTTIVPLAVCMVLCRANPAAFRWLALGASALMMVGIGLSQSRGAWLGAGVAAACLMLAWSRFTRRLLVPCALGGALLLALAVTGALPATITDRLSQAIAYFGVFDVRTVEVTSDNWAVVERMAHWQAGWYMFLDHPWLGVGAGNYAQAYPAYYVSSWVEPLGHAHNYYINMLAELGVVGGGLLLTLLALIYRQLGGVLVRSEAQSGTFWRAVLAGVFGGLVVFCVHNLFDSLFVHSVNIQIGVLLGLGLAATRYLTAARSAT
ncbi:MAG: O-antigen ligase family protein [Chloroflexi bacterium]|nr:O-antigen ligase family protein [Chloroflexota bacterium]MBV9596164.1 O-antigen ligase family protein [Chloroflexota bacterium]